MSLNKALLLASSIQLGLHFWPNSAFVYGIRVDYLSPTLFVLDIGIVLAIVLQYQAKATSALTRSLLSPLLLLALGNLIFASLPLQGIMWWSRLICWLSWATSLKAQEIKRALPYLMIWLGLLTILGITQIILGHSLQGIFYWLGERQLVLGQPGISTQNLLGMTQLRAYSIFSHPNIFAGWSVLVVALVSHFSGQASRLRLASYLLGIVVILVTGSRAAAASLFILMLSHSHSKQSKLFLLSMGSLVGTSLLLLRDDTTLWTRIPLISSSLAQLVSSPVFGLGALGSLVNNHATGVVRSFQPDHFTPTLLLSWVGVVGVIQLFILGRKHLALNSKLLFLLPLLFFDHYLLTSISGLSLFPVVIAMLAVRKSSSVVS